MNEAPTSEKLSLESLVGRVADEFIERLERGEKTDIDEYIQRYPQAAVILREVLQALVLVRVSGPPPNTEPTGERLPLGILGDFHLLREVGRGGMGVVYEAEQISLRRRVALKILPFAATMDPRHLQRFHNEAQAAACLHHTNIVPVYFVGCERGVHFYAMQFIDGQSLDAFLRQQRQEVTIAKSADAERTAEDCGSPQIRTTLDARAKTATQPMPRDRAYFRRIAEWGIAAADALEHAHSLGIVHRDVKPANLLIDGNGRLWVTDFGLARMGTEGGLTLTGDLLGTLRYMSPEQALAKHGLVGYRTDVYSLGVTLYELLTLHPAIDGDDREALLRKIAEEEPTSPRRWDKAIPVELEIIVQKAMAKALNERYVTAQELANDLRRFLDNRPIQARRPTFFQWLSKWSRRHKAMVSTAFIGFLLAVAGLVVGSVLIYREQELTKAALGQARTNYELAEDHRQQAELHRRIALDQSAQAVAQASQARSNFDLALNLMNLLVERLSDAEIADAPKIHEVRQMLLEEVLRLHEGFIQEGNRDPAARFESARAYTAIGQLYYWTGEQAKALEARTKAVGLFESLAGDYPNDATDYWLQTGHSHNFLAQLLEEMGQNGKAAEQYARAVHAFEQAVRSAPNEARPLANLACTLLESRDPALWKPSRALAAARRAMQLAPENRLNWITLGMALYHAGEWSTARTTLEKALTMPPPGRLLYRAEADDAECRLLLTMTYCRLRDPRQAREQYDRALRWLKKNKVTSPWVRRFRAEAAALLEIRQEPPVRDTKPSPRLDR